MWRTHIGVAARALRSRAARSLLTVSSISLGVFAVVLITSLAGSGLATIMLGLEELSAARMLLLVPKVPERARDKAFTSKGGFTSAERVAFTTVVPHLNSASLSSIAGPKDVTGDSGKTGRTELVGVDSAFFDVFRMRVAQGRRLLESDATNAARVCVVGPKLAKKLWQEDALGRSLSVGGLRCRIVGVLASNDRFGTSFGFEWDDLVLAPFEVVLGVEPAAAQRSQITLITDAPENNDIVKRVVNQRVVAERGAIDNFTFYDLSSVVDKFKSTFLLMQVLVGLVAGIALLIGGIGVMNMMLVSVSERVGEVGLRKALGATAAAIRAQFVVEAVLLSGVGGLLGVSLGLGASALAGILVRTVLPSWVVGVSWPAASIALFATLLIGVVFGWLPARGAARLSPVEAMRR